MKRYLVLLFLAASVSLLNVVVLIAGFDPFTADLGIKFLFSLSLFIFIGSFFALVFYYIFKNKFYSAARRGLIVAVAVLVTLVIFRYKFLNGFYLLLIPAVFVGLEVLITKLISKSDYIEDYA